MGLTGFVIIHLFIASFSPAQGECNQMVNTEFTRPVNEMPMSSVRRMGSQRDIGAKFGTIPVWRSRLMCKFCLKLVHSAFSVHYLFKIAGKHRENVC